MSSLSSTSELKRIKPLKGRDAQSGSTALQPRCCPPQAWPAAGGPPSPTLFQVHPRPAPPPSTSLSLLPRELGFLHRSSPQVLYLYASVLLLNSLPGYPTRSQSFNSINSKMRSFSTIYLVVSEIRMSPRWHVVSTL